MSAQKTLLSVLAGAITVAAHGHVDNIVVNGVYYAGYDMDVNPYISNPPTVIGWSETALDMGYISPSSYNHSDIICHRNAKNGGGHALVNAGDSIFIQWSTWPISHYGPVLDYLAACGDSGCETVEKTELKFFKISEKGLINNSTSPGYYASTELIDNNYGWLVQIPESIKPGYYVLRHEIISLHEAFNANGTQNYPQCFNIEVYGSGTAEPEGTLATELYTPEDAGILFNIYGNVTSYPIPGPTLISGAVEVEQISSKAVATSTATTTTALATGPATSLANTATAAGCTAAAAATTTPSSSTKFKRDMVARRNAGVRK